MGLVVLGKSQRRSRSGFRQSSIRKWGWPLLGAGLGCGLLGLVVGIAQSNSSGSFMPGLLLIAVGASLGNLGFFLLLFGILEDRIYEAQGITKNGVEWLGQKFPCEAVQEPEL